MDGRWRQEHKLLSWVINGNKKRNRIHRSPDQTKSNKKSWVTSVIFLRRHQPIDLDLLMLIFAGYLRSILLHSSPHLQRRKSRMQSGAVVEIRPLGPMDLHLISFEIFGPAPTPSYQIRKILREEKQDYKRMQSFLSSTHSENT